MSTSMMRLVSVLVSAAAVHGAVLSAARPATMARSAFGRAPVVVMSVEVRWPDIVRSYVSAKFKTIDLDDSGEVDRDELKELYRGLIPDASDTDVQEATEAFFKEFDADGSGDIDKEEFKLAVMSNKFLNSDMRLKEQVYVDVLKSFDATGDKLLEPAAFNALEAQLDWEGSNAPVQYGKLASKYMD